MFILIITCHDKTEIINLHTDSKCQAQIILAKLKPQHPYNLIEIKENALFRGEPNLENFWEMDSIEIYRPKMSTAREMMNRFKDEAVRRGYTIKIVGDPAYKDSKRNLFRFVSGKRGIIKVYDSKIGHEEILS